MGLDFTEAGSGDFENALVLSGFGKFHYRLLTVCGLIYANTAVGITIISFVLPSATCDFNMESKDKGWLTGAPMLGMVIGSYFWGCLADTKGRRVVLIAAHLLDGIIGLLSSVTPNFFVFMALRFINGFAITGAMGICFPYLGEFQPTKYREKVLCWMELFWTVGIILLPLIAWAIIPLKFHVNFEWVRTDVTLSWMFSSWNLFVAFCALPSIILGVTLFWFPESPKFLIECGETEAALEIIQDIYVANSGRLRSEYPIKTLQKSEKLHAVMEKHNRSIRTLNIRNSKHLKILITEILDQTKALCKPPHLKNTTIACLIQFGITSSYYTLMMWFPELFNRFEKFETQYPNTPASVCDISEMKLENRTISELPCIDADIDPYVYLHTVIVGLACIPTSFWLPLCVHRLGAKFFLIFSLLVAGAAAFGLYFVNNSLQNLILSCIFEALTSMGISTVYCVLVDLFPTNLRVMAAALSLTFGRGGALFGNLIFGYLITLKCWIPIVLFSVLLFLSGILCFFLPSTGREALN
ncbi:synaptic vesicle glycoprotein 2C-like [Uranotaenia lowii]|uniref:synaptic vesicle glycoprotein 2C-like n=1 Tax=Uranotaenia lowii TaxID=190385 RepID=UPI00247B27CB|nr:synaptic vesicle glycoprotein 2C-like [Uranotaenia lowii]XP_055585966.1 synaptic vesicle glycoprotein 2C-like [Uranotaenia lowii]XP_055585967.1 synaptic vesicle glycoprotein 2C-like [Uranotaenia lowii]XP_055585968.1 synaptic vesicle glycoprotein 2C-like [Uranotaenia lowii]XP_055585969.1 synaptic vesicle glycoprotein 2C-like [Uranotaenia lowii]XP_055585970.1 synaptic vesicle glycoprotein 2C-like [Uranotaenia lowii]XP_055585971.1 synaptic vesicle glycoprotein 2C-like [Uranotaenia lowii]